MKKVGKRRKGQKRQKGRGRQADDSKGRRENKRPLLDVGLAAVGADGASVDPGTAVGTEALQYLAADGAEAAADRICRGAVGRVEGTAGNLVGAVAGALRVGTEAGAGGVVGGGGRRRGGAGGRRGGGEGNAEALGQLFHRLGA